MTDGSRSSSASSSSEQAQPAVVRLLVPAVGDLIFVALLMLLVFTPLSVRLLGDAGIGWHIRTGQIILQTGAVPRVDPFSSIMQGKPWFAWEWFYDVIVGGAETSAGLDGVVVFNAGVIALVFALLFFLLRRRGTGMCLAILLTILAASASMIHFLARPHVMTWLGVVLWLGWLDDSSAGSAHDAARQNRRLLWLLPASMLLWANFHGGFLTGFVLLAAFFAGQGVDWMRTARLSSFASVGSGARARVLAISGMLSALATLVNPYGWHLHAHIYRYLTNRWLMDHVQEFQSPNFHDPAVKCFVVLLGLTFIAFGARTRPVRLTEYLLVLFAAGSGLYSARNLPVAAILLAIVAGPLLSGALAQRAAGRQRGVVSGLRLRSLRMERTDAGLYGHVWPVLAAVIVAAVAWQGKHSADGRSLIHAHFDSHRFPEAAIQQLRTERDKEPVLVPDYWGGYFIYQLYPDRLVVVDDRHDLYGEEKFKSYLKMHRLEAGWKEFINSNDVRLVVVPKDGTLAQGLSLDRAWENTATDDVATTFRRRVVTDPGQ